MKSIALLLVATAGVCTDLCAATKILNCTQTSSQGVTQVVRATLDDASEKAEVLKYATTAECATRNTCETYVFRKDTLPSVIRLSSATNVGGVSYVETIDIDRASLAITTKSVLKAPNGQSETTFAGSCKLTVDDSKKIL
jgi:hypothetical protein